MHEGNINYEKKNRCLMHSEELYHIPMLTKTSTHSNRLGERAYGSK